MLDGLGAKLVRIPTDDTVVGADTAIYVRCGFGSLPLTTYYCEGTGGDNILKFINDAMVDFTSNTDYELKLDLFNCPPRFVVKCTSDPTLKNTGLQIGLFDAGGANMIAIRELLGFTEAPDLTSEEQKVSPAGSNYAELVLPDFSPLLFTMETGDVNGIGLTSSPFEIMDSDGEFSIDGTGNNQEIDPDLVARIHNIKSTYIPKTDLYQIRAWRNNIGSNQDLNLISGGETCTGIFHNILQQMFKKGYLELLDNGVERYSVSYFLSEIESTSNPSYSNIIFDSYLWFIY